MGDSITEADSDDFDNGDIGPASWATYADGGGVHVIGGWAHAGATTQDMLGGVLEGVAAGVSVGAAAGIGSCSWAAATMSTRECRSRTSWTTCRRSGRSCAPIA